jgi:hypothetical protein
MGWLPLRIRALRRLFRQDQRRISEAPGPRFFSHARGTDDARFVIAIPDAMERDSLLLFVSVGLRTAS